MSKILNTADIRNAMFSKINYTINDPQKKRLAALVGFINRSVKRYKDILKIVEKNNFVSKEQKKLPTQSVVYMYALGSYMMLVSLQSASKKNKLTKEQCEAITSDINFLIKKYNIDQKKDRLGYDKDGCTKKYKSKNRSTKKRGG
jgi:hypothetical protein